MKKIRTSRISPLRKLKAGHVPTATDEISGALKEELLQFAECHPASRFSRNLRTMLIDFLMFDGAMEANYLPDLLYDIQGLFNLLEAIQAENLSGKA